MGWNKLLKNADNADGCRESVKMSYNRHYKGALRGEGPPGEDPHFIALASALKVRRKLVGNYSCEAKIIIEIIPFLLMEKQKSIKMLAEYFLCEEKPDEANFELTKKEINDAFMKIDSSEEGLTCLAYEAIELNPDITWIDWLKDDVKKKIINAAKKYL